MDKEQMTTDIIIVGSGCAGLYCALQLPRNLNILIITKSDVESSDSYLAQGGICMLKDESDYENYFADTMKAGHYENDPKSVEIMIRSSQDIIRDLISYGVDFQREPSGELSFTREGAHSDYRILFHADITGKEITSKLYRQALQFPNITIMENTTMVDIIKEGHTCFGVVAQKKDGTFAVVSAYTTVWASGGIGGLYRYSTNFRHLTADAVAIALKQGIEVQNVSYVQIHPTTLYSESEEERSFLISESVRGEGAKLYGKDGNRFVDELLPRDLLTEAIHRQMEKDGMPFVWEDLRTVPKEELSNHFPNIVSHCKKMGYDVYSECIPVVPAQHYFMGGVKVNYNSKTSMEQLYAVGETACNGVHGRNRLASNSLLESLVFAKRAAKEIEALFPVTKRNEQLAGSWDINPYIDKKALERKYAAFVREEIRREMNL